MGSPRTWLVLLVALAAVLLHGTAGQTLQLADDNEFKKMITEEQFVLVLFCTDANEERCEEFEGEMAAIREDFIDTIGDAWVIKVLNSYLVTDFSWSKDPVIVFFRSGLPVIYDGPANEEVMLETLMRYKEPGVKELTDVTFEHQTQAATGATTGDWFVMFYNDECFACFRMSAALETVACKHRDRLNVARVNKQTHGEKTGRRFSLGLDTNPMLIFFRAGKMYKYTLNQHDPDSLSSFVSGFYKNYPAESIPLPKTPFDDLVQLCVDYVKEYPALVGVGVALPILLLLAFYFLMRSEEPKIKKSKKKKKDKDSKDSKETPKASKKDKDSKETPKASKTDKDSKESSKKEKDSKETPKSSKESSKKEKDSKETPKSGKSSKKDKESSKDK